jgi:hypothetical protein
MMGWRMESTVRYTWPAVSANLLAPVRPAFRALAEVFVPETAGASPAVWDRLEAVVESALAERPPAIQRQVILFIRILNGLARLRSGRALPALDPARRAALVERLSKAPVLLVRRGVWGLRTLVQMGYYTQPEVQAAIGYRATAAGWAARR